MGFIGGKTQTDIGAMDDLYLDGDLISIFHNRVYSIIECCLKHI